MALSSVESSGPLDLRQVRQELTPMGKKCLGAGVVLLVGALPAGLVGSPLVSVALAVAGIALILMGLFQWKNAERFDALSINGDVENEGLRSERNARNTRYGPLAPEEEGYVEVYGAPEPYPNSPCSLLQVILNFFR